MEEEILKNILGMLEGINFKSRVDKQQVKKVIKEIKKVLEMQHFETL